MSTFPSISGTKLIKALKKADFDVVRVRESHHFLQHTDGRCTVVPVHRGESISIVLLAKEELVLCTSLVIMFRK